MIDFAFLSGSLLDWVIPQTKFIFSSSCDDVECLKFPSWNRKNYGLILALIDFLQQFLLSIICSSSNWLLPNFLRSQSCRVHVCCNYASIMSLFLVEFSDLCSFNICIPFTLLVYFWKWIACIFRLCDFLEIFFHVSLGVWVILCC